MTIFALLVLLVGGVALSASCDRGAEDAEEQQEAPADDEAEEAPEPTSPKGPASIDHAGITEIPDDPELVEEGEELFSSKACSACHRASERLVGPPLGGITDRREPEWLAKMIMHPDEMLEKDPIAQGLLAVYATPMPDQQVEPDETRALLAYLSTLEL